MLQVDQLAKVYPRSRGLQRMFMRSASPTSVVALTDINLHVAPGEVVGLVGPNGAGKTTAMKIISTLLDPSAGSVRVDSLDSVRDAAKVRARIGLVLADDRSLYWRMTGRDNLEFFGVMSGLSRTAARARAGVLLERVGLIDRDKLVFGYSSGMRARLSIARAFMAEPPLLILDEPTRTLDPLATDEVATMIRDAAGAGVAVLLSSHRLDEVEAVCDRISVLTKGSIRFDGTPRDLAGTGDFAANVRAMLADQPAPESNWDQDELALGWDHNER